MDISFFSLRAVFPLKLAHKQLFVKVNIYAIFKEKLQKELTLKEVPIPTPGDNEVLLKVRAAIRLE